MILLVRGMPVYTKKLSFLCMQPRLDKVGWKPGFVLSLEKDVKDVGVAAASEACQRTGFDPRFPHQIRWSRG